MDELLEQFVLEGRELVQQAFDDLLALAGGGASAAHIDGAFRAIHTLKGSVGLFDFAPLGAVLHAAEDLMTAWRAAGQAGDADGMAALLDCMAATEAWIEAVAKTERLPDDAVARSTQLAAALRVTVGSDPGPADEADTPPPWLLALLDRDQGGTAQAGVCYRPAADCFFLGDDPLALLGAVPSLLAVEVAPRTPWSVDVFDPFDCNLVITALSAASPASLREVFRLVPDQVTIHPAPLLRPGSPAPAAPLPDRPASRTLRIEANQVDALADLVGELFVAKNRLAHLAAEAGLDAPEFGRSLRANHADIERLVGRLHRSVMGLRMVPLDQCFRRLPRLVRDTAQRLGRDVRFTIEGAAIQADKATVDNLFEPLLHVLRNAIDHGIEPAPARMAANKPASGRITLRAGLQGKQVVLAVEDDGAGIDPAALRRTALARGLRDKAALDGMDDAAVLDLIFVPGFSTAAAVTAVSGRGVGMDAVRAALHAMGGEAGVASTPGQGTTVRLNVPQAASVTTIVLVDVAGERFGIPIDAITETARVKRDAIVRVAGGTAFVLRDRTVPLLRLDALLGRAAVCRGGDAGVLVIASAGGRVGLEVDGFGARMEVVLRPLHGLLAGVPGMRGSALLGDGKVLLVLEPEELVR